MISKTIISLLALAAMATADEIGSDERGAFASTNSCHDCGCFTCTGATDNGDGTVSYTIGHCKTGGSVSWMCCVGTDGQENGCDTFCGGNKCTTVGDSEFVITVADSVGRFTINTHDGSTTGDADLVTGVCEGQNNQGQSCVNGGYSAHCLIEYDVSADCGFTPTTPSCTTEEQTCPDGSTVSRQLPDCEFADCPTQDSQADTTSASFAKGDPHFKTFGDELYDFHGECDLVLLKNPMFEDMGMEIHVRTKITDWWSAVDAAAIKLGNEILEVNAGALEEWLFINGEPMKNIDDNKFYHAWISGFEVRYRRSGIVREAYIYLNGRKERLAFKTFKGFLRVDVDWQANPDHYKGSIGLLGSFDLGGNRVGRDRKTHIANHNEFGIEWQVKDYEPKLFHSYEGAVLAPKKCVLPDFTPEIVAQRQRRLAESTITPEQIEKACGHLPEDERKSCEYDVMATQDLEMASVW